MTHPIRPRALPRRRPAPRRLPAAPDHYWTEEGLSIPFVVGRRNPTPWWRLTLREVWCVAAGAGGALMLVGLILAAVVRGMRG